MIAVGDRSSPDDLGRRVPGQADGNPRHARADPGPADGDPGGAGVVAVLPGTASRHGGAYVLAAIDDDDNPATIIRYAHAQALRLGVPLRVVHVWTGREKVAGGTHGSGRDRTTDADRLLSTVVHDHLPADEADVTERQILHDSEPAHALRELSAEAALLVMAATSDPTSAEGRLGDTVRLVAGHTGCPLALVPHAPRSTS